MASRVIRYVEGSSVVHALDPRAKLTLVFSLILSATLAYSVPLVLPLLLASLAFYLAAKLPWSKVKGTWKIVATIILFLSLLNYLFVAVLFHPPEAPSAVSSEIFVRVFTPILKLLTVALAAITLVYTTPPNLYAPALGQMGLSYKAAYVIQLGLRYFPEYIEEMRRTLEAQMARGYRPRGGGNFIARILNLAPLVVPVTVSASLSIYDVADAMELRGFGESGCHTWLRKLKMSARDKAVVAVSLALLAAYVALYVARPL
ncbi:MAG: energy-coupling factor transporter transmembrane component T [Thermofilum sp.]